MSDPWIQLQSLPDNYKNEADVEQRVVGPLLAALGYQPDDIASKHPVVFQRGTRGRKHEADFVAFAGAVHNPDTSLLVVEVKRPGVGLKEAKSQAESYATALRAPLFLVTDGIALELWQAQIAKGSDKVFECAVGDTWAKRGELSTLAGKRAAIAHAQVLTHKRVDQQSVDSASYRANELARTSEYETAISRSLEATSGSTDTSWRSQDLLALAPLGAVVVGASGLGKTFAAMGIYRQALQSASAIPVHVDVLDASYQEKSLTEYMADRLGAHIPGVNGPSLDFLLSKGLVLLVCDGLDRAATAYQKSFGAALKNLRRDYPKTPVFLFTRRSAVPTLDVPILALLPLNSREQQEFIRINAGEEREARRWPFFAQSLRGVLGELCRVPLLLRLTISYHKRARRLPTQLSELFAAWIESSISDGVGTPSQFIQRESALVALATKRHTGPMSRATALDLVIKAGLSASTLDDLHARGTLSWASGFVEFEHDALGDYLFAKYVASLEEEAIVKLLAGLKFDSDSFLPTLLAGVMPTRESISALLRRLGSVSLSTYLEALKYRSDLSQRELELEHNALQRRFLEDLRNGLTEPVQAFFPHLAQTLFSNTANASVASVAELGIVGYLSAGAHDVTYSWQHVPGEAATVEVRRAIGRRTTKLAASHFRVDSGRLMGMLQVRDELKSLALQHRMHAVGTFVEERLLARIKCTADVTGWFQGPVTMFSDIETILSPYAQQYVRPVHPKQPTFSIDEVLADVQTLKANGNTEVRWWWEDCVASESPLTVEERTRHLVDTHFKRVAMAYHDVITTSFNSVADSLGFYRAMPLRWEVSIDKKYDLRPRSSMRWRWRPVKTWADCGADVVFGPPNPEWAADDFGRLQEGLRGMSRPTTLPMVTDGMESVPFGGREELDPFSAGKAATSALSTVTSMIESDLEALFRDLPKGDT